MFSALVVSVLLSQAPGPSDGRVVLAHGDVVIRTADTSAKGVPGTIVRQGDQIRTGHDSGVRLLLGGSAVVDLGANTSMVVTRAGTSSSETKIKVWSGRLWARVSSLFGNNAKFEVESPNAVAGVRGTEFIFDVSPDGGTEVTVLDGAVAVTARDGGPPRLLEVGDRINAKNTKDLSQSRASENERRGLRSAVSSGGRLSSAGAPARFQNIGAVKPGDGAKMQQRPVNNLPKFDSRQGIPPIDLDPASGRTRIRGNIQLID
ncbi:MAG: FecR domain-containing protein [Myxococcota bacterium]|nr:FecR family protein [Myxococcota bacterium]